MFVIQLAVIGVLTAIYSLLIFVFCAKFTKNLLLPAFLTFPIFVFCAGFIMRLLPRKEMVDLGFFFTESAVVFIYVLFTTALILGQFKYWGKRF